MQRCTDCSKVISLTLSGHQLSILLQRQQQHPPDLGLVPVVAAKQHQLVSARWVRLSSSVEFTYFVGGVTSAETQRQVQAWQRSALADKLQGYTCLRYICCPMHPTARRPCHLAGDNMKLN